MRDDVRAASRDCSIRLGRLWRAAWREHEDDWNCVCPPHYAAHRSNNTSTTQDGRVDTDSFGFRHKLVTSYLIGVFALLVCLGIFGSIFLCLNGCKVPSLHEEHQQAPATTSRSESTTTHHHPERSQFYSRHRRRQRAQDAPPPVGPPCVLGGGIPAQKSGGDGRRPAPATRQ